MLGWNTVEQVVFALTLAATQLCKSTAPFEVLHIKKKKKSQRVDKATGETMITIWTLLFGNNKML